MSLDFTVVINVRQRFGDNKQDDAGLETQAPFVGLQKDFVFQCPDVDRSQYAILLFQSQGANVRQRLEINSQEIHGGIPRSVEFFTGINPPVALEIAQWNGNVMLVHPGVLQENNVLRIRAGEIGDSGNIDNFIVDNVVIVFKTK